jgi:hypothetical protein
VLIRGNLATGEATTDLKLTGTGLSRVCKGVVHMEDVEATLPFSRLDVSRGSLTFNPKRFDESDNRSARHIRDPRLHRSRLCLRNSAFTTGDLYQ